jgi:predicted outer membrane protein
MKRESAAASIVIGLFLFSPAHAATDEEFLKQAMEINLAEIAMGQLAQERGADSAVKTYGRQLVLDHVANAAEVIALSRSLGIEAPSLPPAGEMTVHHQLSAMSGADFDRAFATRMIEGHRQAIDLFEAKAGEDGEVGDYAEETLPTLEGHLELAEGIAGGEAAGDAGPAADQSATTDTDQTTATTQEVTRPAGEVDRAAADAAQHTMAEPVSADALIGITVYGADNENIGEISDVILSNDSADGTIDAVIIDVGGFLGIGEKPVAMGFDALEIRADEDGRLYAYSRYGQEQLEGAPEYDPDTYAQNRDAMRLAPSP